MEEEKKQPRISGKTAFWMIVIAIIMDLLGPVGTVIGSCVFVLWFYMLHIPLIGPKQLARWGINLIAEGITAGVWVGMTVGVVLMIVLTRTEDKLDINVLDKVNIQGGAGKAVSTAAQRTERKAARRLANPERTAQAKERLEQRRTSRAKNSATIGKGGPEMRDFNYPKAA